MGECIYCGGEYKDADTYRMAGGCCKEINGYIEGYCDVCDAPIVEEKDGEVLEGALVCNECWARGETEAERRRDFEIDRLIEAAQEREAEIRALGVDGVYGY